MATTLPSTSKAYSSSAAAENIPLTFSDSSSTTSDSDSELDRRQSKRPKTIIEEDENVKEAKQKNRQSARECRARKKLRYQYLEELIAASEQAVFKLRDELKNLEGSCKKIDEASNSSASDR